MSQSITKFLTFEALIGIADCSKLNAFEWVNGAMDKPRQSRVCAANG
jgi:hypothetical protein